MADMALGRLAFSATVSSRFPTYFPTPVICHLYEYYVRRFSYPPEPPSLLLSRGFHFLGQPALVPGSPLLAFDSVLPKPFRFLNL